MKIAICGTDKDTIDQCPFDDSSWSIWTMCHRINHFPRVDVAFEMHRECDVHVIGEDYAEWLSSPTIPVWVHPRLMNVYPKCNVYPLDAAINLMGREYFCSSFSYILCKAILDGATEIGVYGINLSADEEYSYQRPNVEYLLGLAQGMGIKITVADGSAILNAPYIYGDGEPMKNKLLAEYEARLKSCDDEIERLDGERTQLTGAQHEIREFIKRLKDVERGVS